MITSSNARFSTCLACALALARSWATRHVWAPRVLPHIRQDNTTQTHSRLRFFEAFANSPKDIIKPSRRPLRRHSALPRATHKHACFAMLLNLSNKCRTNTRTAACARFSAIASVIWVVTSQQEKKHPAFSKKKRSYIYNSTTCVVYVLMSRHKRIAHRDDPRNHIAGLGRPALGWSAWGINNASCEWKAENRATRQTYDKDFAVC